MKDLFKESGKSDVEPGKVYFRTATFNGWRRLLEPDFLKDTLVSSLRHLSLNKKINVYAFVSMPNHIHIIWEMVEKNGKESAHGSFLKFTAH